MKAWRMLSVGVTMLLLMACHSQPKLKPLTSNDVVVAFGNSLTYGVGASSIDDSYPSSLAELTGLHVVNAGMVGEETKNGLDRLPRVLDTYKPALVILCLGGNDFIRQRPLSEVKQNLAEMVHLIRSQGVQVVLVSVPMPNLKVPLLYQEVGDEFQVPVMGNLLPQLLSSHKYKSDEVHLNSQGYHQMAEGIANFLIKQGAIS